jgi:DNA (cytosine-5)-methyltransferase 1
MSASSFEQLAFAFGPRTGGAERYTVRGEFAIREVTDRGGTVRLSRIRLRPDVGTDDAAAAFDKAWLTSRSLPKVEASRGVVRLVDLFAGCGGLTLGVREAARALNFDFQAVLANDLEGSALSVYERNFPGVQIRQAPVETLFDGAIGARPTATEIAIAGQVGLVDIVVGGPPCQGHSDLNNHTRRADPKNELYLRMARCCEVLRPKHVVIENVPGVLHDRRQVAQRTWKVLEELGYSVATGTLDAVSFGVAQHRKRNFTIASKQTRVHLEDVDRDFGTTHRDLRWAIEDLEHLAEPVAPFDTAPEPRPESRARIEYLFDNDLFDLPDSERPDCHRLKEHSYKSMYGRMRYDRPSQTITTGFGVMGRGRYVHPSCRRTITPHEAARIQGFPDFFRFNGMARTQLHLLIGNAVPSKLGYAVGSYLLR